MNTTPASPTAPALGRTVFGSHRDNADDNYQSDANGNSDPGTDEKDYGTTKISTYTVRMPASALRIGHDMKRFLAILMPRHTSIKIHPHTKGLAEVIDDYDMFPIDDTSSKYIFNIKKKTYKKKVEVEMSINVEADITLNKIKYEDNVFALLQEHQIFVRAKMLAPAVTTKAIGCLWNIDPKRCNKQEILNELSQFLPEGKEGVYMHLDTHRYKWRSGENVNIAEMLKIMVDVIDADEVGGAIHSGLIDLKTNLPDTWSLLSGSRLFPLSPIRHVLPPDQFTTLIQQHNKTVYETAEITIDNVWDINTEVLMEEGLREKLGWPAGVHCTTFRETFMDTSYYSSKGTFKDCYVMRGKLYITCKRDELKTASKFVDDFITALYDEMEQEDMATFFGNNTPDNISSFPGRSGTIIFGIENTYKALIDSHMDNNLQAFQTTLKNGETLNKEKKIAMPNYSRPPRGSMYPRGRAPIIVNPDEFRPNAMQSWAAIVKEPKKTNSKPRSNHQKRQKQQNQNQESSNTNPAPAIAQTQITEQIQSQLSSLTTNTQAEFRAEMTKMNERIEAINQRTIESEQRINNLDESIQHMSSALKNLTTNIEKHSTMFDRMHDTMETITHDLHQKTSELGDGIANIMKTLGTMSKKRNYTDINGLYRSFNPTHESDTSMDDDNDQSQSQLSTTSTTALHRARVSSQSSAQIGNNTDQSAADDAL